MDLQSKELPEIAFIVGIGRSGTTLLTNILNSHPQIISTPENEFILCTYQAFLNKNFDNSIIIDSFVNTFNFNFNKESSIWKPLPRLNTDILKLKKKNFANVCKTVYLNYPFAENKENIKFIIDKNPIYSLHIEKLKNVFPQGKYIVLARDFRDNILSRKNNADESSLYDLANAWNYYYDTIFLTIRKYNLSHYLLRYEDLVSNPIETLNKLCKYLEISYSDEMLNFQDLSKEMISHAKENKSVEEYNKINNMHANLENPVNISRIRAYEKELKTEEVSLLNYICFKYGKEFSYIESKPSKLKLLWIIKSKISLFKIKVYYGWRQIYYDLPLSFRLYFFKKA